jgi:hypothetical protein
VIEQTDADADERSHKVEAEQMPSDHLLSSDNAKETHPIVMPEFSDVRKDDPWQGKVEKVVDEDGEGDDETLGDLDSIDASEDVD